MRISLKGSKGALQGNLTDAGVTTSAIDSLSDALQHMVVCGAKHMRIDCARILRADLSSLRLLYTWKQCARFRGIELELVNLSGCLRRVMRSSGLGNGFTGPGL